MAIHFYNIGVPLKLSDRRFLKKFLVDLTFKEGRTLKALTYIFCSDNYLLEINQEFLNHDTLTDIITFPLSEDKEFLEGEIYISLDRVKENAAKFNCTEAEELLRVMFHGLLHLCGFGDKTKKEKLIMRTKEDFYLEGYSRYRVVFVPRET